MTSATPPVSESGEPVPPGGSTPQPPRGNRINAFALIALFGGLLLVAGTFMPWLNMASGFSTRSVSALDLGGDGIIFLGCGVATVCIVAARLLSSIPSIVQRLPVVIGALAGVLGAVDLHRPVDWGLNFDRSIFSSDYGPGAYVLMTGAVVTVAASWVATPASPHKVTGNPASPVKIGLALGALAAGLLGGIVLVSGVLYTPAIFLGLLAILFGVEAFISSYRSIVTRKGAVVGGLVLASLILGAVTLVAAVPALDDAKIAKYWTDENGHQHRYWMDDNGNIYR